MTAHEDPWVKAVACKPAPCHYGCGMNASLREPGKPWAAHKVCAQREELSVPPVKDWDGQERKLLDDRPLGCGTPGKDPQLRGRSCAGIGERLTCQLCPRSPNYWRGSDATCAELPASSI